MITRLPTYKDFEDVSKQCLTQAFNLLYKVYDEYDEYDDEVIRAEVSLEQIWTHNSGTIRTSLILLHQGIETYMKSAICKTTPLLLIEKQGRIGLHYRQEQTKNLTVYTQFQAKHFLQRSAQFLKRKSLMSLLNLLKR